LRQPNDVFEFERSMNCSGAGRPVADQGKIARDRKFATKVQSEGTTSWPSAEPNKIHLLAQLRLTEPASARRQHCDRAWRGAHAASPLDARDRRQQRQHPNIHPTKGVEGLGVAQNRAMRRRRRISRQCMLPAGRQRNDAENLATHRQPARAQVVTYVLSTFCYPCVQGKPAPPARMPYRPPAGGAIRATSAPAIWLKR
jgi:hypothetical protein